MIIVYNIFVSRYNNICLFVCEDNFIGTYTTDSNNHSGVHSVITITFASSVKSIVDASANTGLGPYNQTLIQPPSFVENYENIIKIGDTVTPGNVANHFSAATTAETASLKQIGDVDVSSQLGATNAFSVIDGAIAMTSEVRLEIGAANNRLEATADNLTNISVNIQRSLSSVEDANFASETSALTKAQILQQAATSMLAQANQAKQSMLVLLQG